MTRSIGISWNCYGPLPMEEQIALMAENGFTATFTGAENKQLRALVPALSAAGIRLENLHAPFDRINDVWRPGGDGDRMTERLLASVNVCAQAGIPALVVHLSSGQTPPRVNDAGHERWARIMESAAACGVTVCFENQRMLSNLAYAFETFPAARFCWDVGHEACFTPGRQYMPLFGDRLAALHIHDNHAIFNGDEHLIPYDGCIDMDRTADFIAASGYQGTLMLELSRRNSTRYADTPPETYFARAAGAAGRLLRAVEEKASAPVSAS